MNLAQASKTFSAQSPQQQAILLARLSWELTLVGRDAYEVGTEGLTDPARLRAVNELQHQITQFLRAVLEGDPQRYPDEVFLHIIFESSTDAPLRSQLDGAFNKFVQQMKTAQRRAA